MKVAIMGVPPRPLTRLPAPPLPPLKRSMILLQSNKNVLTGNLRVKSVYTSEVNFKTENKNIPKNWKKIHKIPPTSYTEKKKKQELKSTKKGMLFRLRSTLPQDDSVLNRHAENLIYYTRCITYSYNPLAVGF